MIAGPCRTRRARARRAKKKGKPAPADQLPGVLSPLIASIAKPDPRDVILGWLAVARTGTRDIATGGDWLSIEGEDWRLYTELAPTFASTSVRRPFAMCPCPEPVGGGTDGARPGTKLGTTVSGCSRLIAPAMLAVAATTPR